MDKDTITKLIKNSSRFFPSLGLLFILEKTNSSTDLFFLILALLFAFYFHNILLHLMSKLDLNKVEELVKKKKNDLALYYIINTIRTNNKLDMFYHGLLLLTLILFNVYTFYRLIDYWELHIAKILLVVGFFSLFKGLIRYLYHLFKYSSTFIDKCRSFLPTKPSR